jgi:hypothetical protein
MYNSRSSEAFSKEVMYLGETMCSDIGVTSKVKAPTVLEQVPRMQSIIA